MNTLIHGDFATEIPPRPLASVPAPLTIDEGNRTLVDAADAKKFACPALLLGGDRALRIIREARDAAAWGA